MTPEKKQQLKENIESEPEVWQAVMGSELLELLDENLSLSEAHEAAQFYKFQCNELKGEIDRLRIRVTQLSEFEKYDKLWNDIVNTDEFLERF